MSSSSPPANLLFYTTLSAKESFTFPLTTHFQFHSKWVARNGACRTGLFSNTPLVRGTLFPTVIGASNHNERLGAIVDSWRVTSEKLGQDLYLRPEPLSYHVLVDHPARSVTRIDTQGVRLSAYGLHCSTHELLVVSDCADLDTLLAETVPSVYWHQRLACIENTSVDVHGMRLFSRWNRWSAEGLTQSQRYSALEAYLLRSSRHDV